MLPRHSKIALFTLLIFVFACKNELVHQHDEEANETHEHIHSHDHELIKELKLNNGEKWVMQPALTTNIENMEMAVKAYKESNSKEFEGLAALLENESNLMIKNCTMQGESHNELHKWLEPHLAMIKDLKAVDTSTDASPIIDEIDASFELLRKYFE